MSHIFHYFVEATESETLHSGNQQGAVFCSSWTHTYCTSRQTGGWGAEGYRLRYTLLCGGWYMLLFHRGCWIQQTGHLYSQTTDSRFTAKLGAQVNIFPLTNGGAQRASNRWDATLGLIEEERFSLKVWLDSNFSKKKKKWTSSATPIKTL